MNEFLRLIRKIVRPMGYDLKRHHQYTLHPFKTLQSTASYEALQTAKKAFDSDTPPEHHRKFDTLNICLRTCLRHDRNIDKTDRLTGTNMAETTYRCIRSLVTSVNFSLERHRNLKINLICLEDHSDQDFVKIIESLLNPLKCPFQIITTSTRGQGPSLHQQFTMARESNDSLWYFVEDDYLHHPEAIAEMCEFYEIIYNVSGSHLMIHPQEHENLYKSLYPSYIFAGPHRHWRTTSDATHVFLTHNEVVQTYWDYFENVKHVGDYKNRRLGSEAKTTNNIFKHIPGFSPIPGLACHLQFEFTVAPFFDWVELWEKNSA
jgi:hypothetical protein